VESNWVHSALRPPIGLSCQPRVIMMMEKLVEWLLAEENEVLGGNLPQCGFVHHKSHMNWPSANPDRRGGKPATNRLSYGTATIQPVASRYADYSLPTPTTVSIKINCLLGCFMVSWTENGDSKFLRNVGNFISNYIAYCVANMEAENSSEALVTFYLIRGLFYPKVERRMFLRIVGNFRPDSTATFTLKMDVPDLSETFLVFCHCTWRNLHLIWRKQVTLNRL
jgi:hypothetical protein